MQAIQSYLRKNINPWKCNFNFLEIMNGALMTKINHFEAAISQCA